MSSKKQRRSERRRHGNGEKAPRTRLSAPAIFMLAIVAAVVVVTVIAFLSGGAEAPFPGAVWSEEHGHWH